MQMVAGAKLRRLQGEFQAFQPYADRLRAMTERFLAAHPRVEHPFLSDPFQGVRPFQGIDPFQQEGPVGLESPLGLEGPAGLIVIISDTGLCGTYNDRVLAEAEAFLREYPSALVVAIGKKGNRSLARKGIRRIREILDWGGRYAPSQISQTFAWLQATYLKGTVSAWWIAYTQFISTLRLNPTVERLLPIARPLGGAKPLGGNPGKGLPGLPPLLRLAKPSVGGLPERFLVEPDLVTATEDLLWRFVMARFQRIVLEAFTSEHSARMIAMKNATDNAEEMIHSLTLVRNKVRQAAITKELIEVVSGAEALK
jgi:F-type H+-transporting ATPase subunit gamma